MRRISNAILKINVVELGVESELDFLGKRLNQSLIEDRATDGVDGLLIYQLMLP